MGQCQAIPTCIHCIPRLWRLKKTRQRAKKRAGPPQPPPFYQYIPLPEDGRRWIRLVTIYPGVDEIHLELSSAVDFDMPDVQYEALSYVWGSEDNPIMAKMGRRRDCVLPITQNLAEALRHLRYQDRPRVMWIDALCIDQNGLAEKGHQVAMMADVYKRARRVIAWLGPEADDSARGLEVLEQIGSQVDYNGVTAQFTLCANARDTTLADRWAPLELSPCDADAIISVLWRKWFERLWVRQEVAFAHEVACCIGESAISLVDLRNALYCIREKPFDENSPFYNSLVYDRLKLAVKTCTPRYYELHQLHHYIRGTTCKDPRDRIYAVLSLLKTDLNDVVPDYCIEIAKAYESVTLAYLTRVRSLDIFGFCEPLNIPKSNVLCSWVPDWSKEVYNLQLSWTSSCCGNMFRSNVFPQSNGVLSVEGVYCAKIRTVQEIWADSRLDLAAIEKACSPFLSANIQDSRYVSGESFLEALCRTLNLNGFADDFQLASSHVRRWAETLDEFVRLVRDQEPLGTEAQELYDRTVGTGRFFVADGGYIGVASRCVQPGDIVVLFLGCEFPIVLRPELNEHYLVGGGCYMHGVMAGEPLLGPLPDYVHLMLAMIEGGYNLRYFNEKTNEMMCEDPRLQRLEQRGLDLEPYRQRWRLGESARVKVEPGYLEQLGLPVRRFDLI